MPRGSKYYIVSGVPEHKLRVVLVRSNFDACGIHQFAIHFAKPEWWVQQADFWRPRYKYVFVAHEKFRW